MLKKIKKSLKTIILLFIVFCFMTIYIDYQRILKQEKPIFNISSYNENTRKETFNGFFYKVTREIKSSPKEPLEESKNIKMTVFNQIIKLPKFKTKKLKYTLLNNQIINCNEESKLYYSNKDIKIYTYCISSLKVKESNKKESIDLIEYLKEDYKIIYDIKSHFKYNGLYQDMQTLIYKVNDTKFTNDQLMIYECNKENVNDIYIVPKNTEFREDFCTNKNDDWDFLWEIEEKPYTGEEEFVPDLFYEDEKNLYELKNTTKENIFLVTPKLRGRERTETPLMEAFSSGRVTLDELTKRGLKYNIVDRKQREEELRRKEEEERKKQEEEERKRQEETKKTAEQNQESPQNIE